MKVRPCQALLLALAATLGAAGLAAPSAAPRDDAQLTAALAQERAVAGQLLTANISPPGAATGAVIASPSRQNPDYFFVWVRDAAITMREVVAMYASATAPDQADRLYQAILDYAAFARRLQLTSNLSQTRWGRGIGEPKFNIDGSAFMGPWGRPQDDGPAARAITLIAFANDLLREGRESVVLDQLYDGKLPTNTVIKADLEYLSHFWRATSFDLWEEVRGHHFYTQVLTRRALLEGAKLAYALEDTAGGDWYTEQALALGKELDRHWDPVRGYVRSTVDRDGGIAYKTSDLDSSVILGTLDGEGSRNIYPPTNERILATAAALESAFAGLYPINQRQGVPGEAIGRYPEDRYDGYSTASIGNPWVLTTEAFAAFYYRLASSFSHMGSIPISAVSEPFFKSLGLRSFQLYPGLTLTEDQPGFTELVAALKARGDAYMARVLYHKNADGSLAEEINRDTGFMQGAPRLSLSFAEFLAALRARSE